MASPVAVEKLLERVEALLDVGDTGAVVDILRRLHPADSSEILYRIPAEAQNLVMQELPWEEVADVLEELDEEEMVEVVSGLTVSELADVLDEIEPDMAADLIGELDERTTEEILTEMEAAAGVAPLLAYSEDSAGGIMNSPRHMLQRHVEQYRIEAARAVGWNEKASPVWLRCHVQDRSGSQPGGRKTLSRLKPPVPTSQGTNV